MRPLYSLLRRMRRRFTFANVVAVIALLFSMSGAAIAARHYLITSTRQISPRVLRELRGRNGQRGASGQSGAAGAMGPAGAQGPAGSRGATGAQGATGSQGVSGPQGVTGPQGATGSQGVTGPQGPAGPGVMAYASNYGNCFLASEIENFCYPSAPSSGSFTASANGTCLVSASAQIEGVKGVTTTGPYFRIAIKEGAAQKNDELSGEYFEGSGGEESIDLSRTMEIPVSAGKSYDFGVFFGYPRELWHTKSASYIVTYTCFAT